MTGLLVLACIPIGFVLADVARDWRKLFREINGESLAGLQPAPPRWTIYLAWLVIVLLVIVTRP